MKKFILFFILIGFIPGTQLLAQDTLPNFSVKNVGGNRIVIGWTNTFETVKQISIQRSLDSLKNFKTILTVPDPDIPQNGFVDTKAQNDRMFYRLYILLDKGVYLFSPTKRPILDTAVKKTMTSKVEGSSLWVPLAADSATGGMSISNNRIKSETWIASKFIYTSRDGYIRIQLPDDPDKKYSIKFFTADNDPLFEIKEVKARDFKLDKTNFYRSGWFKFELYEDGELKEKNKFFLPSQL